MAQKHYLQVTDSHFEKSQQNARQQPVATLGNAAIFTALGTDETPENAENTGESLLKNNPTRARRPEENAGKTASFQEGGAKSGAVAIQSGAPWADIRALIEACPNLSPAARRKLISLGDKATEENGGG
ncbi:MAG: hypothetical protein NTX48_15200, partial [Planctomycetales bacterium]|nr:hypothetical protein [Planctomycetales bacterium]